MVPPETVSPDVHYGVTVPRLDYFETGLRQVAPHEFTADTSDNPKNSLIDLRSGKIITVIKANVAFNRMNRGGVVPSVWGLNDSLLLWKVDGRFSAWALVLLKIREANLEWQLDLLKTGQQAILERTREANPVEYAEDKKENAGNGSAYPDGFTVDVTAEGETGLISIPIVVHAYLTSNPKGIESMKTHELNSRLNAIIDAQGHFTVTKFYLGSDPPAPNW